MSERTGTPFEVRPLAPEELRDAAWLHARELPHEFLTHFGPAFLARYYRAFVESPHAVALAVGDPVGRRLDGVLIATFDTRAHYACLVRRHGFALAWYVAARSLRHPRFARVLIQTRLRRYARGILRSFTSSSKKSPSSPDRLSERVGFLVYMAVDAERRGRGIGGALLATYEALAQEAGLERLDLVTNPDERGAGPFYAKAGWTPAGERVSGSGERYALYTRELRG